MAKPNVARTTDAVVNLRNFLETQTVRDQIGKALPAHLTVDRILRQCMTLVQSNTKLLECSQISILSGIVKASELGLELNGVLGQSYLVPRWNDKAKVLEATFQVGWRGFVNLAFRTGKVASMPMRTVHEFDAFSLDYGSDQKLFHRPLLTGDRGQEVGYYACVTLVNGGTDFEFLTRAEAEAHRDRYAASDNAKSPWLTSFGDMAMKTCVRRLGKRLPLSVEFVEAAVTDEYGEAGVLPGQQQESLEMRTPRSEQVYQQLTESLPVDDPSVSEPQ